MLVMPTTKNTMKTLTFIFLTFFTIQLFAQDKKPAQDKHTVPQDVPKPFVLGMIDKIQSQILGEERIINIYLPPGFNKNDSTTYAVTYLLDGSADEDFIHIAGLYQFNSFEW